MKIIINNPAIAILSMLAFTLLPAMMLAADMWAETPGLNDETETASAEIGPATFKYRNPDVDIWAETPDLNVEVQLHDAKIDPNSSLVSNFIPEMYAETPDLDQAFAERQVRIFDDTAIAEK